MNRNGNTVVRRTPVRAANDNGPVRAPARRPAMPSAVRDYLVLLAVFAGVALAYWLAVSFLEWNDLITCVTMGKRGCLPPIELHHY
ncbi:MAG TPA: hypothetical protein VMF53_03940 [Alphaproteobacteria bacterium]|nr:hypothetical protein [Alphaproteobacteria bacterium]